MIATSVVVALTDAVPRCTLTPQGYSTTVHDTTTGTGSGATPSVTRTKSSVVADEMRPPIRPAVGRDPSALEENSKNACVGSTVPIATDVVPVAATTVEPDCTVGT